MKRRFDFVSHKRIDNLPFTKPRQPRQDYFDTESRLCLRVGSLKKTWFIRYQLDGKRNRYTIGRFPEIPITEARSIAKELFKNIADGVSPSAERTKRKQSPDMNDLWQYYLQEPRHRQKAEQQRNEEIRKWNKDLSPYLGRIKVADLTRNQIKTVLMKKAETAPVLANRLHSLVGILLDVALDHGLHQTHLMYRMARPGGKESPRKRFLRDAEIKAMWQYTDTLTGGSKDILRLILLTCQRPGEVMGMKWDDIDLDKALWNNSVNKTGTANLVPLSDQVMEILQAQKRVGELVFPATGKKKHYVRTRRQGMTWTPHDLRRTGRTIMSRLQIKDSVAERVLGHAIGGVQGVYNQYSYLDEKKSALQLLADEIFFIISDRN